MCGTTVVFRLNGVWCTGSILVGQGLANDLQALQVSHPIHLMRDTLKYRKFQRKSGEAHSLKYLAQKYLGLDIHQQGQSHLARCTPPITLEAQLVLDQAHSCKTQVRLYLGTAVAVSKFV